MKKNIVYEVLKGIKRYFFILILLGFLVSYITIQIALLMQYAIDGILLHNYDSLPTFLKCLVSGDILRDLIMIGVVIFLTTLICCFLRYIRDVLSEKFSLKINQNLKTELFSHIFNLEYSSYNSYEKAEIIQRLNEDADSFSSFFKNQFSLIIEVISLVIFIIGQSMMMNSYLAYYIVITMIILLLFTLWYYQKLNKQMEEMISKKKSLLKYTLDNVKRFRMVKLLNRQKEETKEYKKRNDDYTNSNIKLINLMIFYEIISDHITYLKSPVAYLIGGLGIMKGVMTLGEVTAYLNFTSKLFNCFLSLGANLECISDFSIIVKKLNNLYYLQEESKDNKEYNLNGDIIYSNVSLRIENQVILNNINFIIHKGEKVAIIGDNGSGKSILLKSILGFYDYDGKIYINNHNVSRINKANIRQYIELLVGESFLFSGSLLDNIKLNKQYDMLKLRKLLKQCELTDEVNYFKDKMNTMIGENGIQLSGGQKQRVALARSLYQDKQIMLLDEVLNKLDNKTRERALENLYRNNQEKTIIVATHNMEILKYIDKVIFISNHTTYVGTHKELLERNKEYKKYIKYSMSG